MTSDTATGTAQADASTAHADASSADDAALNTVQVPLYEGLGFNVSNSALAARDDDLPRNIRIRGLGNFQLRKKHSIGWDDVTGLNDKFVYCRQRNDFSTADRFFRRLCEINGLHKIELGMTTRINEIMHAWYGCEYSWWRAAPGRTRESVTFRFTWRDLLCGMNAQSKHVIFGHEHKDPDRSSIVACLYIRLKGTCDPQNRQLSAGGKTYFRPAEDIRDGKAGFAFVRDDGKVMLVCPKKDDGHMNAYWLSKELLSALAEEHFVATDREERTLSADTVTKIARMPSMIGFRLRCSIIKNQVPCLPWEQNHGTPWGEGPPSSKFFPYEENEATKKWVRVVGERRKTIFTNAQHNSAKCDRCDLDFHSTALPSAHRLLNRNNPPYGDLPAPLAGVWVAKQCAPSAQAAYATTIACCVHSDSITVEAFK